MKSARLCSAARAVLGRTCRCVSAGDGSTAPAVGGLPASGGLAGIVDIATGSSGAAVAWLLAGAMPDAERVTTLAGSSPVDTLSESWHWPAARGLQTISTTY